MSSQPPDGAVDPSREQTGAASPPPAEPEPIVRFEGAGRRLLGGVVLPVAGIALAGAVVDGAVRGLTFALLGRWAGLFVVGVVLGAAVATALHALGGAGRAGARGERLSSPDVGIAPRRIAGRGLLSDPHGWGAADAEDDDPLEDGPRGDGRQDAGPRDDGAGG